MTTQHPATLADLLEPLTDDELEYVDGVTSGPWSDEHADAGVVIYRHLLDDTILDAYAAEWLHARETGEIPDDGGWTDCTPYMRFDALRAVCIDYRLARALQSILHEPAGVHLNLTGWISTERSWHQDGYLNPPDVGDSYAAVWIALEDVAEDAGPFEWIPGSHMWGRLTRERMLDALATIGVTIDDPMWPSRSEQILDPLVAAEMERRGVTVERFLAKKGDVLIWHPRLMHRGSPPATPGKERRALIAHYSGVMHRPDMPSPVHMRQWHGDANGDGGWFFPIGQSGPVR